MLRGRQEGSLRETLPKKTVEAQKEMELISKKAAVAQRVETIHLPQRHISSVNASTRARAFLRAVFFFLRGSSAHRICVVETSQ